MKKLFTITSILTVAILIAFACKKSSTTSTPATTSSPTSSTTSTTGTTSTPTNTTSTNFAINGSSASNLQTNGSASSGEYLVFVYDAVNTYPQIQINFLGNMAPATGTYSIVSVYPSANQCNFWVSPTTTITAKAISGVVNVVASPSPNNTSYFTNIVCTYTTSTSTTTYTVTGALRY
jgi:hypothetical protein